MSTVAGTGTYECEQEPTHPGSAWTTRSVVVSDGHDMAGTEPSTGVALYPVAAGISDPKIWFRRANF